jgi:Ca2+-binding EF-hand superfamily protein
MGAEVTLEDLIDLLAMYDVDQDMNIDIDEFIHIMNKGDDIASINQ